MKSILLISVLAIFTVGLAKSKSLKSICTKKYLNHIDNEISKLLTVGNSDAKFPLNNDELPNYCR